jgi:hypothetical protein
MKAMEAYLLKMAAIILVTWQKGILKVRGSSIIRMAPKYMVVIPLIQSLLEKLYSLMEIFMKEI